VKVSKVIIPFLGLTNVNNIGNAKNQISQTEVIQLEKEVNPTFYEIMSEINWNNYSTNDILTNKNTDESLVQEIQDKIVLYSNAHKNEVGEPRQIPTSPEECERVLQASLAVCALLSFMSGPCVAAAYAIYVACLAGNS
jgi:hypothetical protein